MNGMIDDDEVKWGRCGFCTVSLPKIYYCRFVVLFLSR